MSLSPLYSLPVRPVASAVPKERARVNAAPASAQQSVPLVVEQTKPPPIEQLSVDDAHALSIESVNALIPISPALVGRMVIDAGRRRRAELPLSMTPLSSQARAILLCGELRRGRQLSESDRVFLDAYLESIGAL